jgi:hypothetical protein
LLYAIREVDPEKVPDWGGVYDPEEDAGWTSIRGLTPGFHAAFVSPYTTGYRV